MLLFSDIIENVYNSGENVIEQIRLKNDVRHMKMSKQIQLENLENRVEAVKQKEIWLKIPYSGEALLIQVILKRYCTAYFEIIFQNKEFLENE